MSTDPEASPFEEALRADLPSAETEARLRRRLLAAGLAVGNGIATTTAAAAGSASAASGGLVANVVGLSWGIKLGFAAAVAIPTLGLLLDEGAPAPSAASSVSTVSAPAAARAPVEARVAPPERLQVVDATPIAEPRPRVASPPSTGGTPRREAPPSDLEPTQVAAPHHELPPSQRAFAAAPETPLVSEPNKTTLAEETRLLDAAFAELGAGNRLRASQLLAEHESRYPQGLLSKERERAKIRLSELSRGD
jgi:hypothetical protein